MTQLFPNHGQLITVSPMGFYIRNRQYWNSIEGSWISTWLPSAEGSSGQSWNEVGDLELRPMWGLLLLLSPPTTTEIPNSNKKTRASSCIHRERDSRPQEYSQVQIPLWPDGMNGKENKEEWFSTVSGWSPWSETGSLQACNVNTYPRTPITHQPMALVVTGPITKLSCQHWIPLKGPLEISPSLACFRIFH